jgi:cell wall-associated NlpC family hydrolase
MAIQRFSIALLLLAVSSVALAGCAAATAGARPSPFPVVGRPPSVPPATIPPVAGPAASQLIQTAIGFQGVPYKLGGETPETGFDCSGFVRYVFAANHVVLPRTASEQFDAGMDVPVTEIRAGDLLFFSTIAPGPSHVGIAIGDGRFVHAPGANSAVRLDRIESPYWREHFIGARRLVN